MHYKVPEDYWVYILEPNLGKENKNNYSDMIIISGCWKFCYPLP
jgi:hypothetical protein